MVLAVPKKNPLFVKYGTFEFRGCPECGSAHFTATSPEMDGQEMISFMVQCHACGFNGDAVGAKPADDLLLGPRR